MEQIGLQAKFDLQEYDANAARYVRTQAEAQSATERASAAMTQAGTASTRAAQGYNIFSTAVGAVVRGVATVVTIIGKVVAFMANLATMAIKVAAAITIVAFAIGKLDKLLLWIAEITKKLPVVSNLFKSLAKDYQAVGGSAGAADSLAKRLVAVVGVGSALVAMRNVWRLLRGDIQSNTTAVDKMSASLGMLPKQMAGMNTISVAIGSMFGGIALNAINSVIYGIQNLIGQVQNFAKESVFGAARAREFMSVLYMMGAKQGITSDAINESVQAIRNLGIEMSVAQNLAQQAIRYNISLATAEKLARVAQDAAVVGQMNSSEALDRLIWGMTTQQTEVLRTMGLNVRFDESFKQMAKDVGKSSEALTTNERIMAAANAIIKEGATISGAYVTAQKDASKELRSFPRYVDDIKIAMGAPFLGAFDNVVFGLKNMLKTLQQLITTKGPIQDLLYLFGGLASAITDPLLEATRTIQNYFTPAVKQMAVQTGNGLRGMTITAESEGQKFVTGLVNKFTGAAESALRWGVNIVASLAEGMAQGAAWALTSAMNVIGNLLSSWLGPGSAPRVAPGLPNWGQAAATEWLKGFTEADFSMLDAIQGPLKQVLDVVGKGADFTGLSLGLVEAIKDFSATGMVSEAIFTKMTELGDVYGQELAELTALQFALADATNEINNADRKYIDSQNKVSTLTAEYNKMMRSGASKEALKTKLAEINAAEKAKDQAAEDKVAATEKATMLKQQADLQGKLLSQLVELAKAQEQARKEAEKPKAEAKAGKAGTIEMPEITMPGIDVAKPIDKALEEAKKRIQAKLADIFKPLATKWETSIKPALEGVASKFEWFKGVVKRAWDALMIAAKPVIDIIKKFIPPDLMTRIGQVVGVILVFAAAVAGVSAVLTIVGAVLGLLLSPIALIIAGVVALKLAWDNNFLGMRDTLTNIWERALPIFTGIWEWLSTNVPNAIKTAMEFIGNLRQRFSDVWTFLDINVIPIFRSVAHVVSAVLEVALRAVHGFIDKQVIPVIILLHTWFDTKIKPAVESTGGIVNLLVTGALTVLKNYLGVDLIPVLNTFLTGFLQPIRDVIEDIKKKFESIPAALEAFAAGIRNIQLPWWLMPGSPTPMEEGLSGIGDAAYNTALSIFGSDTSLGAAVANVSNLLKTDLLWWLGPEEGLIAMLERVQQQSASAMGTIGEPLEAVFYMVRAAAADAAGVAFSVVDALNAIAAKNGMIVKMEVIIHEITYHEDREGAPGGAATTSGGPRPPSAREQYQHGGWTPSDWIRAHSGEFMISQAMRAGRQPIPTNVFSEAALMRMGAAAKPQVISMVRDVTVPITIGSVSSDMDLNKIGSMVRREIRDELRRR